MPFETEKIRKILRGRYLHGRCHASSHALVRQRARQRAMRGRRMMSLLSIALNAGRLKSVPRRWVVVAAATFGMLASFGMTTTIAVFMKPFEDEFGWLRAD